jgi:hypothetical protein
VGDACVFGVGFEFAIAGMFLAGAGGGVIRHQEFEDGFSGVEDLFRIGDDLHAGVDRADTGGGQDAAAGFHQAEAADAHGSFVLQVAESGDGDAVHAGGVEDASARGDADGLAVDGEIY